MLKAEPIEIPVKLHQGEVAAISLVKKLGVKEILIDEKPGRFAAKVLGLKPRGIVFVLLRALGEGLMSLDDFLDTLSELMKCGFRLREEVVVEAIKEAKRIADR